MEQNEGTKGRFWNDERAGRQGDPTMPPGFFGTIFMTISFLLPPLPIPIKKARRRNFSGSGLF